MSAHALSRRSTLGVACLAALAVAPLGGCERDRRPATWEYISPAIMQPSCATASCHGRAAAVAGLDFSDGDRGYKSLTRLWVWIVDPKGTSAQGCKKVEGTTVCKREVRPLVNANNPDQSRLTHVLRAEGAPRMPPDRPLPEADIRLVEQWILNGARRSIYVDAGPSGFDVPPAADAPGDGPAGDGPAGDAPGPDLAKDGRDATPGGEAGG